MDSAAQPPSVSWFSQNKTLTVGGVLAFISIAIVIVWITLQALSTQQDLRQQAAIENGLVEVTQSVNSPNLIIGQAGKITLAMNTNGLQTDGVELHFEMAATTTASPQLTTSPGSNLSIAAQEITQTSSGFAVKVLLLPSPLGTTFSSSTPTDVLEISFTPTQVETVQLTFDPDVSFSTVHNTNPPQDELKFVASIAQSVENPPSPSPSPVPTSSPSPSPSPSLIPSTSPSVAPSGHPTPTPPPGCFYQDIQCFTTPCEPLLVCATPEPSPVISPLPTFSPSPSPLPSPVANPILIGQTLPEAFNYQLLVIDNPPVDITLDANDIVVQPPHYSGIGYGQGFKFEATAGDKLGTIATEVYDPHKGSYIKTVLYGPNKQLLYSQDTRIELTAPATGTYYLVVYTFLGKTGDSQVRVFNRLNTQIIPFIEVKDGLVTKLIDLFDNDLSGDYNRVGRHPARIILSFPSILNITGNTIRFQHRDEVTGDLLPAQNTHFELASRCQPIGASGDEAWAFLVSAGTPRSSYHLERLDNQRVALSPTNQDYFPAGHQFAGQLLDDLSWTIYFSTIFPTGGTQYLTSDSNGDHKVNLGDYTWLINEFFQSRDYYMMDLNCDNRVDIRDYTILVQELSPLASP